MPLLTPAAASSAVLLCSLPAAQVWDTPSAHPGDSKYHQPDFPLVFVANQGEADAATETGAHLALDVMSATNPAPQGPGGGLYVLLPNGRVEKLFPLPVHESLIDTPAGHLERGAVVEPNLSEDGRTLYFAYFHDASFEPNGGGWQSMKVSYKGADLYRLDVGALRADPGRDPATLPIRRLTHKRYAGDAKSDLPQTLADRTRDAVQPLLATQQEATNYWGNVDMHLIELRTRGGLKALWVSDRTRLSNSNDQVGDVNRNFSLFMADFAPDGSLGTPQQAQYYTTTSALSPIPMREGYAFSYQSSTEEVRRWDLQWIDSEGRWKPLLGYAHSSELFHLGTLVVERDTAGHLVDSFIGVKYYHLNDEGFGALHLLRTADAGTNRFVPLAQGLSPRQLSSVLTLGALDVDGPSGQVDAGGERVFIGKFSSPRAGRVGGEYFMAYTPTSANRWIKDADGRKCVWESELAYRPNLAPFRPHDPVDVALGNGLRRVVRDASRSYDLTWPTPILSWLERTGESEQRVSPSIIDRQAPIPAGAPIAQVGTSALWNTDVRPYDCYLGAGEPFNPNGLTNNEQVQIVGAQEGLRLVADPEDFCRYLGPENVLGIQINLTSSRTDSQYAVKPGYQTDGTKKAESVRVLGVYSVLEENASDQSFQARIPADVPFEFHLLDRRYGMKLADVRSWHSLKPRETRNDCGGCHQHEAGFAIPFAGTEASGKRSFDMTSVTTFVSYDADCRPVVRKVNAATVPTPEWKADVWPGFSQHCGVCHDLTRSSDTAALAALDFASEEQAYERIQERNYAGGELGALGSPVFWAAIGARTDGRRNELPQYAPDYAAGIWGYHFSAVHATQPGLCASSDPVGAQWVCTLGHWIDNHMPRDTGGSPFDYQFDRYPPTVDFALLADGRVRVGFWDDRGRVALELQINGVTHASVPMRPNGGIVGGLPAGLLATDELGVIASDSQGNRQLKTKTLAALQAEMP